MLNNFTFINPTKIIFGKNTGGRIGEEIKKAGITKVLLVYGKGSIFKNGVYDSVTASLQKNNVKFAEVGGVQPNPVLSKVQEGIDTARQEQVQAIVPVGGGSVYDSAKAIAAGHNYDGNVWDFFARKAQIKSALPIFGVLTISATGSEMNNTAVITKEDERKKWVIAAKHLFPQVSIIDPSIQATLPAKETVNGVVDIMTHVLELYFDGSKNVELMQEYSEGILRTVMKHVQVLVKDASNYESRAQIAWAAALALNGSNSTGRKGGDWATHIIEHSLSAFHNDISHGAGLAILFPAWMRYVYKEDMETFERFAEKIFAITQGDPENKILTAIDRLKDFHRQIGAPTSLKESGIAYEDLEKIAENATLQGPLGTLKKLEEKDVLEILKIAYE